MDWLFSFGGTGLIISAIESYPEAMTIALIIEVLYVLVTDFKRIRQSVTSVFVKEVSRLR